MILIFSFREKGLTKVCDLIFDVMEARMVQMEVEKTDQEARIGQLEEEKTDLSNSLLEKIPECRVNSKIFYQTPTINILLVRFVLKGSRRIFRSSAVWLVIISVDPARPARPSR